MPRAGVYVLAGLISSVSAALILASAPSHTEPRSLRGTVHNVKQGQSTFDEYRASPSQIVYRMHSLPFLSSEYVPDHSASELCGGLLFMGTLTAGAFSYQEHGGQYALLPKGNQANHAVTSQHTLVAWCMQVCWAYGVIHVIHRLIVFRLDCPRNPPYSEWNNIGGAPRDNSCICSSYRWVVLDDVTVYY